MAAAVLEIVADYDVRHITPRQMAELSRRLYDTGAIGQPEYAGRYLVMQWSPDQPRDFVAEWRAHLTVLQHEGAAPPTIHITRELVELIRSFRPVEDE